MNTIKPSLALAAIIFALSACNATAPKKPNTPEEIAAQRMSTLQVYDDNRVTFVSAYLYSWPNDGSQRADQFVALEADGKAYNAKSLKSFDMAGYGAQARAVLTLADGKKVSASPESLRWLVCDRNKVCDAAAKQPVALMTGVSPTVLRSGDYDFRNKTYRDPRLSYYRDIQAYPSLKGRPSPFAIASSEQVVEVNQARESMERRYEVSEKRANARQAERVAAEAQAFANERAGVKASANEKVGASLLCQTSPSSRPELPAHTTINCIGLGQSTVNEMQSLGWRVVDVQTNSGPNEFNNMTMYAHNIKLQKVR